MVIRSGIDLYEGAVGAFEVELEADGFWGVGRADAPRSSVG